MRIDQYRQGDIEKILGDLRPEDIPLVMAAGGYLAYAAAVEAAVDKVPMMVLRLGDDTPVALVGVNVRWPGVGELWMSTANRIDRDRLGALRASKRGVEWAMESLDLHRLECTVDLSAPESARWVEWIGFQPEGIMKRYTPDGRDHMRYAIVREG